MYSSTCMLENLHHCSYYSAACAVFKLTTCSAPLPPPRLSSSRTLSASSFAFLLLCLRSDSPLYLLQLVIYGVDGVFQTPPAVPFGQALVRYLEYNLMPRGAEVPAQLIVDLVAAKQTDEVAAAFDEAVSAGYTQQLVAVLQQVCSLAWGRH